jgi:hypothetical protein
LLAGLRGLGFECLHAGTYRDPITEKIRQFDIRAVADRGNFTLALAVECKNLRDNNPLLLSAVPRTTAEAFRDLLRFNPQSPLMNRSVYAITGDESAYRPGEMVGKKTDQVGRDSPGSLVSNDEATFDKLNQAVNSCRDLIYEYALKASPPFVRAVVPLLVVPAGLLWQVDYNADGGLEVGPRKVTRATFFLNHSWRVDLALGQTLDYRLSHVELVTVDALAEVVEEYFGPGGFFKKL